MTNLIQEQISNNQSILGYEVMGVDGCQAPRLGVIKELSVYYHSLLGNKIQVWVEWDINQGHLTPYEPRQFSKWESNTKKVGVYYIQ